MWESISMPWQQAFLQAWEACKNGSIPIGAVILDENGEIISVGRNRIFENTENNPRISHAEMEAMRTLDTAVYPNVKLYTLYTTMEPCPMCFGTMAMCNLRTLHYAARDSWCGAVHYNQEDPYLQNKNIQITFEGGLLETVQLTLQLWFEMKKNGGESGRVYEALQKDSPLAAALAQEFLSEQYVEQCLWENVPFSALFNRIAKSYQDFYC